MFYQVIIKNQVCNFRQISLQILKKGQVEDSCQGTAFSFSLRTWMPTNRQIGTPPVCSQGLAGVCESAPQGWEPAFPAGPGALCHSGILWQPGGLTAWNSLSRGRGCLSGHFLYSPVIEISTYPLINTNAWHLDGILVPASDHLPTIPGTSSACVFTATQPRGCSSLSCCTVVPSSFPVFVPIQASHRS